MSCNGCRVLRKGCSESCVLRTCLQWIDTSEAQGHATVFVAKFFGRAGLMSFVNGVPHSQRPALFQSLLFEACGRTINPVTGAVGLRLTGNWHLCQAAAETVLRGGTLHPLPELSTVLGKPVTGITEAVKETAPRLYLQPDMGFPSLQTSMRHQACSSPSDESDHDGAVCDLDLWLTPQSPDGGMREAKRCRPGSPSLNSEVSVTSSRGARSDPEPKLLSLFV